MAARRKTRQRRGKWDGGAEQGCAAAALEGAGVNPSRAGGGGGAVFAHKSTASR